MKRLNSGEADVGAAEAQQKRAKSSVAWLGTVLQSLKSGSHPEGWHASKQLVVEGSVEVSSFTEDAELGCACIAARVCPSENASAFPHMRPTPQLAAPQAVAVRLVLHPSTGQLLDADTSCCPGAFQPVLGSFCPYAVAALLAVAKQAQLPSPGSMQAMDGLPAWEGSSLQDVLRSQGSVSSSSPAGTSGGQADPQQQQGLQRVHDALVAHPTCFTGGLGLEPWQFEGSMTATADVHVASQRTHSMYGSGVYGGRPATDPDKLALIEDASEDLNSHPWFQNVQHGAMQQQIVLEPEPGASPAGTAEAGAAGGGGTEVANLPPEIRRALMRAGIPVVGVSDATVRRLAEANGRGDLLGAAGAGAAAAAAAEAAAKQRVRPEAARKRVLEKAIKQWLTTYGGDALSGWQTRPKVINDAFDLLLGSDGTPGRPLSAVVLLLRGLWEYLHHHGLGRLLAKPFKLLLALRSVLLVGIIPLWARKAVCCQLELWQKGLLWQNAATPLDATGGHVGLVHLLKIGQEVHQLCQHHWDEPHLSRLLSDAFSEQHTEGGSAATAGSSSSSSASKPAAWTVEQSSLLQLRLQVLDAMGASAAYLELAMAGGAWREAINRLLTSKERSQLLKAVKLLTRHITSLPERLRYMSQIVQLDSLGAPERLEVTARLLLDLREQLHPVSHPVKVSLRGAARYNSVGATAAASSHMWKVTLWSLQQDPAGVGAGGDGVANRAAGVAAATALQRQHIELEQAWSKFLKLFLQTAAEALFKSGEESIKAHREHLKEEGLLEEEEPEQTAGGDEEGGARPERPAPPAVVVERHRFFCPSCNRIHDHEEPLYEPPIITPQPGDPDWKLLDIDDVLFGGAGPSNLGSIPTEAITGALMARSPAGYIQEQRVIDAYKKAVPVSFPQLLPLCGLDALCISAITTKLMEDFDAGGKLDTSLGIEPLRELLSHPVVEMGPGTVRLQAAIEAVVYASTMTPLYITTEQSTLDGFYRELAWALLGVGQRSLALLVSRARYKVIPSARAAGELLEVAISCGPEAQAAAVDLILGKGCVKPLGPEDDAVVKELEGSSSTTAPNAAAADRPPSAVPPGLSPAEYQLLLQREAQGLHGLEDYIPPYLRDVYSDDSFYSDDEDVLEEMYGPLGAGMLLHPGELRAWQLMEAARVDAAANAQRHLAAAAAGALGGEGGGADDPPGEIIEERREGSGDEEDGDVDAMSISGGESGSEEDLHGSSSDMDDDDGVEGGRGGLSAEQMEAAAVAAAEEAAAVRRQRQLDGGSPTAREVALSKRAARLRRAADKAASRKRRRGAEGAAAGSSGAGTSSAAAAAAAGAAGSSADAAAAIAAAAAGTQAAGTSAAAAAAAAGRGGRRDREQAGGRKGHPHHPDREATPAESDGLGSFDTRELLGSDAAAVLQLKDTASSRGARPAAAAAGAAAGANGAAAAAAGAGNRVGGYDEEDDIDYRYGRPARPMRNVAPAQPAPRPSRRPSKRHAAAAAAANGGSCRAAAGGGGGGGGGDEPGGDGGPSHADKGHKRKHHHHHRPHSRNRRSGSHDGVGDPQQQALVSDLFGISHASHSHPLRTLRVHVHRLAGLQLWTVTKYAAGRGADKQQLQRLGMAAWLSDGNTTGSSSTGQVLRMSEALRWSPVASDAAGWLEATQQLKTVVNTNLQPPPSEPYAGVMIHHRSWSGLPCGSWDSFVAQERYPASYSSSSQHHDTPDANLAWLMSMLTTPPPSPSSSSGGAGSSGAGSSRQPPAGQPEAPAAAAGSTGQAMLSTMDQAFASGLDILEQALPGRQDRIAAALSFIPIPFQGALTGYSYRVSGPLGPGYYKTSVDDAPGGVAGAAGSSGGSDGAGSSAAAEAAAAAAGGSDADAAKGDGDKQEEEDGVAGMLQNLAHLSKGIRFGLPMLQLCHALMESGCRQPCLELLPQALLPAGGTLLSLQLHTSLVTAMQELLPMVAKHGDTRLRVGAAVSYMLVTRRALPAPLISEQEVLSGVVSWWVGLAGVLHVKPEEWSASVCTSFIQEYFNPSCVRSVSMGSSNWQQLQRMLVTSILASLGGSTARSSPHTALPAPSTSSDPNTLAPAEGYQLLLQCEAVKEAHWTFRLYLARLCHQMRLAPTWSLLSGLLCPALSAAVAEHTSGWAPGEREPLTDMKAWKEHRTARAIPHASARARDWVADTLEWLSSEVLAGQVKPAGSAPGLLSPGGAAREAAYSYGAFLGAGPHASVAEKEKLRAEFLDTMAATLAGWSGPELVPLVAAMRPHNLPAAADPTAAATPAQAGTSGSASQPQLQSLNVLLQAGLLPRVGRADELVATLCVSRGQYRTGLRTLMGDRALLAVLPQELVRCLALTYWQQEATPEGFLTANEVLLRLEGASSAQTLALPAGTSPAAPTASAASAGSSGGGAGAGPSSANGPLGLAAGFKSLAAGLRSFVPGVGGEEESGAAMPQVHAVLLEQLDLVPSKGGIEAAGLRFMQLQRHAAKGDHAAALESIFSSDSSSSGGAAAAQNAAGPASLSAHMEVVDAVLRLAADASSSNEALRSLMSCAAYSAIVGLESLGACSATGAGPLLLAPLSDEMKVNVLKLCVWRLVRGILQRPPPIELRKSLGPGPLTVRGGYGDAVYNRSNPPVMPSHLSADCQAKWMNRTAFNALAGYCMELGLVQTAGVPAHDLALRLCTHLEQQELALLWALKSLAALLTGPQLEGAVVGLISPTERGQLEQLPVLMAQMGETLKRGEDRKMMWVFGALRNITVAERVTRYIRRNVGDVPTLQRYLAKSTIAELQGLKATSMPWASWELGTKAAQAQELAEWLYWLQVTWPNLRTTAGAAREAPALYNVAAYGGGVVPVRY